jgi:hypothetical protein
LNPFFASSLTTIFSQSQLFQAMTFATTRSKRYIICASDNHHGIVEPSSNLLAADFSKAAVIRLRPAREHPHSVAV